MSLGSCLQEKGSLTLPLLHFHRYISTQKNMSIYSATLPSSLSIVAHKRLSQLASVAAISFQCPVSSLVQLEDLVVYEI